MNIFFAIALTLVGLSLIIWHEKAARSLFNLQLPGYKKYFGNKIAWEKPAVRNFYRIWMILIGTLLIIGAAGLAFGPIYL